MINTVSVVETHIVTRIESRRRLEGEIRREKSLLFHNLRLRTQLVVEGIAVLFLKPIWHLRVTHVVHLHLTRQHAEGSYLGQQLVADHCI